MGTNTGRGTVALNAVTRSAEVKYKFVVLTGCTNESNFHFELESTDMHYCKIPLKSPSVKLAGREIKNKFTIIAKPPYSSESLHWISNREITMTVICQTSQHYFDQ